MAYSLKYFYDSTSKSYFVTGWSGITTTDKVVIPSIYDDGTNGEHPVTRIDTNAFYNCTSLTDIIIPNSITYISDGAFSKCSSLTSVTIPDSITSIGVRLFYNCTSLTSVTIGNGITHISMSTFYDCRSLTSVTIPDSVTSIGNSAFYNCSSLTSVTIGNSVRSIGNSAFYNCSSLKTIILFPETPPTLGSDAISTTISTIYVQQSSKEAYKTATNWTSFADKIEANNTYLSLIRFNKKNKEYIDAKVELAKEYADSAVSAGGKIHTNLVPDTASTYNLGSRTKPFKTVYADTYRLTDNELQANIISGDISSTVINLTVGINESLPDVYFAANMRITFELDTNNQTQTVKFADFITAKHYYLANYKSYLELRSYDKTKRIRIDNSTLKVNDSANAIEFDLRQLPRRYFHIQSQDLYEADDDTEIINNSFDFVFLGGETSIWSEKDNVTLSTLRSDISYAVADGWLPCTGNYTDNNGNVYPIYAVQFNSDGIRFMVRELFGAYSKLYNPNNLIFIDGQTLVHLDVKKILQA